MRTKHEKSGRFGVKIWGLTTHAEVNSLADILEVLEGHTGHVLVVDRKKKSRVFEGSVDTVRSKLVHATVRRKRAPALKRLPSIGNRGVVF